MMNQQVKRSIGVSLLVCGLSSGATFAQEPSADLFGSPFDHCFADGYNISEVTGEEAFATAECFTDLLVEEQAKPGFLGASKHTILEYSASWYQAAADKGHPNAKVHVMQSFAAIDALINSHINTNEANLLASEQKFQSLDRDSNGLLTGSELASSTDLRNSLQSTDLDQDGALSYGEYAINYGEATAAGGR